MPCLSGTRSIGSLAPRGRLNAGRPTRVGKFGSSDPTSQPIQPRPAHNRRQIKMGLFNTWEYHGGVDFKANGKDIKVDEWRKQFKEGEAIIRMGYMRIDNCPRFQIVILFNKTRIMADKPLFRNFNDALAAADAWLAIKENRNYIQRRKLTAVPMDKKALQLPPPVRKPFFNGTPALAQGFTQDSGNGKRLKPFQLDIIITEEYHKLDYGRTSLKKLQKIVCERVGYHVSLPSIQKRTGINKLYLKADKKKALVIAKPIVKEAIKKIMEANPDFGAGKCYYELEQTDLAGYRAKWVKEIYHELRKESGGRAKSNSWAVKQNK